MSDKIDVSKLLKARSIFERFRQDMNDDRAEAGAVQAFEFCYEMSWKMMKRVLESRGYEVGSPKDTFRKAAIETLIDDPEIWFEFQRKKNLTFHTYEHENVKMIIQSFNLFSLELDKLIMKFKNLL